MRAGVVDESIGALNVAQRKVDSLHFHRSAYSGRKLPDFRDRHVLFRFVHGHPENYGEVCAASSCGDISRHRPQPLDFIGRIWHRIIAKEFSVDDFAILNIEHS
jgi:hypothetical protein